MLTFEKVLKVFDYYLVIDTGIEVVLTSHGYTVMYWDNNSGAWIDVKVCETPEKLMEELLDSYFNYLSYLLTNSCRELTKKEVDELYGFKSAMKRKCYKESSAYSKPVEISKAVGSVKSKALI